MCEVECKSSYNEAILKIKYSVAREKNKKNRSNTVYHCDFTIIA